MERRQPFEHVIGVDGHALEGKVVAPDSPDRTAGHPGRLLWVIPSEKMTTSPSPGTPASGTSRGSSHRPFFSPFRVREPDPERTGGTSAQEPLHHLLRVVPQVMAAAVAVSGGAEDPGTGLLDRQNIVAGDLELDLHGERFTGCGVVQLRELLVDHLEMLP